MELSELTAYAEEKFHIKEQHKWADFPGYSVLADPNTGKWAALLMRQWDSDTGTEIQRCDIKCGQESLFGLSEPFLSRPFRMKGQKWVGVKFDETTKPEVVFRLFDRAVYSSEGRGYTIVLDDTPAGGGKIFRGTALLPKNAASLQSTSSLQSAASPQGTSSLQSASSPQSGTSSPQKTASSGLDALRENESFPGIVPAEISADPSVYLGTVVYPDTPVGQDTALPSAGSQFSLPEIKIPRKIQEMLRLYQYKDGSFVQKCRNFYRQGKFMENYEDNAPWDGVFKRYFPTYHDLNLKQLRGYFTWRSRIRKGEFSPITTSFAYIYLYELLNGIGTSSPEDGLKKMREFETGYLDSGIGDQSIRRNLRRWMLEYAVIHDVSAALARQYADPAMLKRDAALAALKNPEEAADEEIFSSLCFFEGKKLEQSPVVKKEGGRGKHLFAEVWRCASKTYSKDGKDLFAVCFGKQKNFSWYPLANAVCWEEHPHPDADYELDACRVYRCRRGIWREERYDSLYFDRGRFRAFWHETDRGLRKYLRTGHYLHENPDEAWVTPYVEKVLEDERQKELEAARPKITINLSDLEQIRQDALLTRDSLLTAEDLGEDADLGPVREETAPGAETMEEPTRRDPAREESAPAAPGAETMEEPVRREPDGAEAAPATAGAEMSAPPASPDSAMSGAPAGLDAAHLQILRTLLDGKPADPIVKANHLMPSVAADTINEAFFDEIGDNILECDGDAISVVEDYREDILQMLGGRNG